MDIPLCIPAIDENEINAVKEVLNSGWLAHGPKTKQFEKEFADFIGTKKAITLNSCTSALQLAISALDLKGEIILPSFTFVASANAIENSGCTPVFVDIRQDTRNINENLIEQAITDKTVAIMPVHYAGQSCNMEKIMQIADKHNLVVIEDSAECIGGTFNNKLTGSFGIGCFSFYPTKNFTTGEGGMITTNDEKLADKIAAIRAHGIKSSTFDREKLHKPWIRASTYAGVNFRMCDILSAIGVEQMKKINQLNDKRRQHAQYLSQNLKDIEGITIPVEAPGCKHVYQMYTIQLDTSIDRSKFVSLLKDKGIRASVHFDPPVHLHPYYQQKYNFKKGDFPVTELLADTIVTLPMFPDLTKDQLDFMISEVKNAAKELRMIE